MLFDLRGKGRRRTVQITYAGIALLFLFTFVFVGVGTGLNGNFNFFEAVGNSGNGGGGTFGAQVEKARKRTHREPNSPAAWAKLVEEQLRQASESRYTNATAGGFTSEGKKYLAKVAESWERYLTLETKNPSVELAKRMASVFGEEGLNKPAQTVQALEIAVAAEPTNDALYADLAQYSYQANNISQGDLAAEKALALAPQSERAHLKGVLNSYKKNATASSTAATTAPATVTATATKASTSRGG